MRTVYVYRNGQMVNKATGEPMNDGPWTPAAPQVMPDTPGYHSPIDGKWVEGKRARRYDLESNDCVDVGGGGRREFKNERFMKKWGLTND